MDGLYALKPWYSRRLGRVIDLAVRRGASPDAFTLAGVLAAAVAAAAIAWGWWPVAALALAGRLASANLDGAVARARGVSRPWGAVLNEVGDRAADLLGFAGLAVLAARTSADPSGTVAVVAVAALAATLPTFAALAAATAGATRRNGGPLGKTERCLLLVLAAAVPAWTVVICWLVVAGSLVTATVRLAAARAELGPPR